MSEGERPVEIGPLEALRKLLDGQRIGTIIKNSGTIRHLLANGVITLVDGTMPDGRRIRRRVVRFT